MNTYIVEWMETQEVVVQSIVEANNDEEAITMAKEMDEGEVIDITESYKQRDYEASIEKDNMNNQIGHLCSKCKKRLFKDTIKLDSNGNETCTYCGNILKYSGAYIDKNVNPEETYEMFS